jgi:hypothetical protein
MKGDAQTAHDDAEGRLIAAQIQTMPAILTSLVWACRDRFVSAARLLDLQGEDFAHLHRPGGDQRIEVGQLSGLYETLMLRYLREVYDSQTVMFEPTDELELRRWTQYAYWALIPKIAVDDAMARDVMRAIGAHPCRSQASAFNALVDAAVNMTMPPMPKPEPKIAP